MKESPGNERLELSPNEARKLGYRVVDLLVEHMERLGEMPVGRTAGREELDRLLMSPLPEEGEPPDQVLDTLLEHVYPNMLRVNHPRFFAFVPGPGNLVSVFAETLSSGFNVFSGTWLAGSGTLEIELVVVDWLRRMCGFPEEAGGLFVSGGSVANLTALAVAREIKLGREIGAATAYFSDQTHSSIERAFRVLGFGPGQLRTLPSDNQYRLRLDLLEEALAADRKAGKKPFCVVANAGTTNTGAVDDLPEISELCRREDLWLHADGAYGAAAALSDRGRKALEGLEFVDSLSLDPHKWLFQPFETGCVIVRDRRLLRHTFHVLPEYLRDTERLEEAEINMAEYGIQLTRSPRAVKLWMSLKVFGARAFRNAIDRGFELAEYAEGMIEREDGFEIVTPAQLGIVSFRFRPPGAGEDQLNRLNEQLQLGIASEGVAMLSSTRLKGRTVLRMCTINPRTTREDIAATIRSVAAVSRALTGS